MSRYLTLINEIKDYITDNGKGEITGGRLQRVLEDMVNQLGDHTKFIGVVAPEDKFEGAEGYLFAFAVKAGTYTNFGGYTVRPDEIAILIYDGGWKKYGIDVVTDTQLENTVAEIIGKLNDLSSSLKWKTQLYYQTYSNNNFLTSSSCFRACGKQEGRTMRKTSRTIDAENRL